MRLLNCNNSRVILVQKIVGINGRFIFLENEGKIEIKCEKLGGGRGIVFSFENIKSKLLEGNKGKLCFL